MVLNTSGNPDFAGRVKSKINDIVTTSEGITSESNKDTVLTSEFDVTTAGTGVNFASQVIPDGYEVKIKAKSTNTDKVYIGSSEAIAEGKEALGAESLSPKDSITLKISNLNLLWIDSEVSGEGVTILSEVD